MSQPYINLSACQHLRCSKTKFSSTSSSAARAHDKNKQCKLAV